MTQDLVLVLDDLRTIRFLLSNLKENLLDLTREMADVKRATNLADDFGLLEESIMGTIKKIEERHKA